MKSKPDYYEILFRLMEEHKRLVSLRRWTRFVSDARINELGKQALNWLVLWFLATDYEKNGKEVKWTNFPLIALYHECEKAFVLCDTPRYIFMEILSQEHRNPEVQLHKCVEMTLLEKLGPENENIVRRSVAAAKSPEMELFKAACLLATLIEISEVPYNEGIEAERKKVIKNRDKLLKSLPEIDLGVAKKQILKDFARLRNQNRWALHCYSVPCSVLGHLYSTAMLAYFMALENGMSEEYATKAFFMGIFHDVPETYTSDIPSPVKDKIPGFRRLTELFEQKKMHENVYSKLDEHDSSKLRDIMFEETGNEEFHALIKGADYLQADFECFWQKQAGNNETHYFNALLNQKAKLDAGTMILSPAGSNLYNYILQEFIGR